MADYPVDGVVRRDVGHRVDARHGAAVSSGGAANLVNKAGGLVSVGLVIGACVWGFQILSRDVSGVPVVRALEGPMRIQPEDPGGSQADHQGLSVNNVAAEGSAAKPADRLVVAPPPISISGEAPRTLTAVASPVESENLQEIEVAAVAPIVAPEPIDASKAMGVEELAAQLAAGVTPLTGDVGESAPVKVSLSDVDELIKEIVDPAKPVVKGGLKRSLRPVARPADLATRTASAALASDTAPKTMDAADIPAGTRMVQLGAFASPEIASREWDKLLGRFDAYLSGKTRVIQKASSGGRTFYRLRAMGFGDVSDARRLCSALKAENADCIPVTTR
ncbi:Sporulation related domain protein [Shimia sp. SK013]|uniref:SPOR domain-containing protein n=1 Tax=Shimia sp. SK013 TaxID=1389006 RepID=UPI0006B6729A|nr:SPOR domain-containing protein [Shimia sp. SK013]KPA22876.1 Sporulation related domain protein [Shimia sp. SK013]